MIKQVVIFIGLAVLNYCALGQSMGHNISFFDEEVNQRVEVEGFGSYGSNVMDVETMKLFYQGGYFDEDLKAESIHRLTTKNLLGGEYGAHVTYLNPNVKWLDSAGVYLTYEIGGGGGVAFTQDLFKLVFVGNHDYVGDSAFLSGTEFTSYAYKKVGFGYNRGNKFKLGLSLLSFDNYSFGQINRGIYYSDAGSDSLSLMLSGDWMRGTKQQLNAPAGYGLGLDFEMNLPYEDTDSMNLPRLVVGVKNFGVFMSAKQMDVVEVDTLYNYSGVEMNSLAAFGEDLFSASSLQDSLLPDPVQQRKFRLLPFEFYFYSTSNPNGKKMQLIYGMRYRFGVSMIPQIYLGGDWRPTPTTIITPYMQFGGYSYFKTGVSIRKRIGNLGVGLNFSNVPGFITREAYQQSAAISLSYGIK
ncbi:hypothetical protein [Parvicella tangerina]|uniref:DUF5723 domain-containing protein n=1 Tax=Parvicella tangerina TaxID=2829795 RepID=A0A916JKB5_9FLAO|nr:hypothetical protein [Parvicella tangerina]CAG5078629.1 hypothetical protein CRYO30217_00725 [Parvicella tangerina]